MKLVMAKKKGYSFDPIRDGVTQTFLHTWLSCREKARMSVLMGYASPGAAWPLVYGAIMHTALESYYGALVLGKELNFDKIAASAGNAYVRSDEGKDNLERQDMACEASALVSCILPAYEWKWGKKDKAVEWTAVEKKFARPVLEANCVAVGKIDGGFRADGADWLFETKNKSSFAAAYDTWLGIDLQLGYYLLGYEHLLRRQPVGAVYNLIRRPDRLKTKSTSFDDYLQRTREDVAKRPDHYFTRYRVRFSKKDVLAHERSVTHKLTEFRRWYDQVRKDERDLMYNPGACEQYGSKCFLLDSCAKGDRSGLVVRKSVHPELA